MYEHVTYETILARLLERVTGLDKREGSIIWNALAPAAAELQLLYIEFDTILRETFADTASRDGLVKRAAERGITPHPATPAILRGEFNLEVPVGSRFSLDALNYVVTAQMEDGSCQLKCEAPGSEGNRRLGTLVPVDYIKGLTKAELVELLVPGEDEEETENLRKRYFTSFQSKSFGGNIQDYRDKVNAMAGVGAVKVYSTFAGGFTPSMIQPPPLAEGWLEVAENIPETISQWLKLVLEAFRQGVVTVGAGTVRLVLLDSQWAPPTQELIQIVQEALDPLGNNGEGYGEAPIGHVVTVVGAQPVPVNIVTKISYLQGYSWERLREPIENAVDEYLLELRKQWGEDAQIAVRISQMEARILTIPGVLDISRTTLNGTGENLFLDPDEVPVKGAFVDAAG